MRRRVSEPRNETQAAGIGTAIANESPATAGRTGLPGSPRLPQRCGGGQGDLAGGAGGGCTAIWFCTA